MKKLITVFLATVMLLSLSACTVQDTEAIIMEAEADFSIPDITRKTISLNSADLVAVNDRGELLVPNYFSAGSCEYKEAADVASVDVSSNSFAVLYNDGSVDFMFKGIAKPVGSEKICSEVEKWTDIVDIACTDNTVIGLTKNGQIKAASKYDEWAQMTAGWANIIAIDFDGSCLTALRNDGKVFVCQRLNDRMYNHCPDWTDIVSIHTNGNIYGVSSSGRVYCYDPVTKVSSELSGLDSVIKVSGDKEAIVALKSDSSVVCLKDELNGKISQWTGIADIAGNIDKVFALTEDGRILYATTKDTAPCEYEGWSGVAVPTRAAIPENTTAPEDTKPSYEDDHDLVVDAWEYVYDEGICYHIPRINSDDEKYESINAQIYEFATTELLNGAHTTSTDDNTDSPYPPSGLRSLYYSWGVKDNILSIVLETSAFSFPWMEYYEFAIDLDKGTVTENEKITELYGYDMESFYEVMGEKMEAEFNAQHSQPQFDSAKEYLTEAYDSTMAVKNIRESVPFIGNDGELYSVCLIHTIAGAGMYYNIIPVTADIESDIGYDESSTFFPVCNEH